MNNPEIINSEEKILRAAEEIFLRDGYAGSRMQDIADLAGINKALLHYYFRSKDKLFDKIFEKKAALIFPQVEELLHQDLPMIDLMCIIVERYFQVLLENPYMPLFIISSINKPDNQSIIEKLPFEMNKKLIMVLHKAIETRQVKNVNPVHFIISVFSMCIFPFMAKPMIMKMTNASEEEFKQLMQNRIIEVQSYIKMILDASPTL
jgi:TetR/AcrR family transcriptional regulator